MLEICISDSPSDYNEAVDEINRYCDQLALSVRTKYKIHLVLEELVQQILIPSIDNPQIDVCVEYSSQEMKADMSVRYNGRHFNPADSDNELSYKILKSMTSQLRYSVPEEDGYTNQIECIISE